MRNFLLYLLALLIGSQAFSQSNIIDSLENQLNQKELSEKEKKTIFITLAGQLNKKGLPGKAIENLDLAAKIQFETDSLTPLLYQEYAKSYYLTGEFLKALEFSAKLEVFADLERDRILAEAKKGKPRTGKILNVANVYTVTGEIYRKIGDYQKALEYGLKSKEIAELLGMQEAVANNYNNIGIVFKEQGDLKNAKAYYLKALDLNQKLARRFNTGSNYNNIGLIYRRTKQYDSALICFQEALKYIKSDYGVATIYSNIGAIYYDLKVYDSAQYYHQNALIIQEKNGFKEQMSLSMINLAGVRRAMKRYDESIGLALKAYEINEQEKNYDLLNSAALVLANAYEDKKDFENSLSYFRKHKQYYDSVYNEKQRKEVAGHQLKFRTMEKEKENELLRKQAELQEARISSQFIIGIILVAVLLLSIWVLYLTFKRNKVRQELANQRLENEQNEKHYLEKELTFKNKELVNFALQIVEKNDFMTEVTREIDKLSKNGAKGYEKVKELSKKLKANYIINKHQKEFDAHVNSVYESFYNKLEDKYPDLTQNEKRLAALLRLKLSSKEISSITGISSKSVDMSRYRLRKKLGLDTEDNLIEVLNQV